MLRHKKILYLFLSSLVLFSSCKKDFLDKKPSSSLVVPQSLEELEKLLETEYVINQSSTALGQISADEYYFLNYQSWQATMTKTERNAYIWEKDLYGGDRNIADWNKPYAVIFYCNNVIEGLRNITVTASNKARWNDAMGRALFTRAFMFFDLVSNFSPAYDSATAATDLGVPLKLKPGIDDIQERASAEATYQQILTDLKTSSGMLITNVAGVNRNRPTKASALAMLSRVCLNMRSYATAELYADSTLGIYNQLIDYNTVDTTSDFPFTALNNQETLYASVTHGAYYTSLSYNINTAITIDSNLYRLFSNNDLRKAIYFGMNSMSGQLFAKAGYYPFYPYPFTGLATDEIYLIKAECAARRGDVSTAMTYLNALLEKRYLTGRFTPFTASTKDQALQLVLIDRRKELVWRGQRWLDLKRLNKEGANIELKRVLNGTTYTLAPNSPLYVFPIPDDEISLSGIQQNNR